MKKEAETPLFYPCLTKHAACDRMSAGRRGQRQRRAERIWEKYIIEVENEFR